MLVYSGAKAMSIYHSKIVVSRALVSPFGGALLLSARRAGINTAAAAAAAGIKEPDMEVLAMLVCPFSKVIRDQHSSLRPYFTLRVVV